MKLLKIILINLLISFVLIEGGMRTYYSVTNSPPPHSDHSVYREWRWVMKRLDDGKVNFDKRFTYDPYAGWKNAPSLRTQDSRGSSIRTNAQGMRNDQEFSIEPSGKPRLLIVGDSYSFGHAVSNEDTFAYILGNEYLPNWEVMNLAVSATGTDQNYIMYERYGEKYQPDVVLLGFYVLDFNRNTYSFRDYAKPMYVPQDDGGLVLTHSPVPHPRELIAQYRNGEKQIGGWHYSYAYAAFMKIFTDAVKRNRDPGSLPRRTLTGIMEKFVQRARNNGSAPVWVIFPIRDIVEKEISKYAVVEEFATQEAQRLGMPVLRLEPIFRDYLEQHPDALLWNAREVGGHLSPAGNQLAAQSIHEFLKSHNLITADKVDPQTH